ncbi:HGGxSTG domain-containing protein [Arenimonas sp.]|uniref:HGGxSTG domain-containing protein n=1 Tax=Arenimonas sp. TaxID=1872635 RepID=UPI0039C8AB98
MSRVRKPAPRKQAKRPLATLSHLRAPISRLRKKSAGKPIVRCGAKTQSGKPCRGRAVAKNGRCRWHGGYSTGPKTPEGIARVTANLPHFQRKAASDRSRERANNPKEIPA